MPWPIVNVNKVAAHPWLFLVLWVKKQTLRCVSLYVVTKHTVTHVVHTCMRMQAWVHTRSCMEMLVPMHLTVPHAPMSTRISQCFWERSIIVCLQQQSNNECYECVLLFYLFYKLTSTVNWKTLPNITGRRVSVPVPIVTGFCSRFEDFYRW